MQAHADAGQMLAQEVKHFAAVAGNAAEGPALLRCFNRLAAVVFADFQAVVIGREAVIVAAVLRLNGKGREAVGFAVAPVGLVPGKDFTQRRDRQLRQQRFYPGAGGDQGFFA
ncbi:hypothetical protein GGER_21050 [Serratia rubidaea]